MVLLVTGFMLERDYQGSRRGITLSQVTKPMNDTAVTGCTVTDRTAACEGTTRWRVFLNGSCQLLNATVAAALVIID